MNNSNHLDFGSWLSILMIIALIATIICITVAIIAYLRTDKEDRNIGWVITKVTKMSLIWNLPVAIASLIELYGENILKFMHSDEGLAIIKGLGSGVAIGISVSIIVLITSQKS